MKTIKRGAAALGLLALSCFAIWCYPQPMFAHHMRYQNYEVWSDQAIAPQMAQVLDDATRRLRTSELYKPDSQLEIFLCNAPWRLWFYGGRFNAGMGGGADMVVTRHITIRASDIPANRVRLNAGRRLADEQYRPLSYFIAHEAAHVMESRQFGPMMVLRTPTWLVEGYADHVGKGGDFDFDENRKQLALGVEKLDPKRSGLYRRFQLEVDFLLNRKGMSVAQLFADPPDEAQLLDALKR
jgi:hypothetical protein